MASLLYHTNADSCAQHPHVRSPLQLESSPPRKSGGKTRKKFLHYSNKTSKRFKINALIKCHIEMGFVDNNYHFWSKFSKKRTLQGDLLMLAQHVYYSATKSSPREKKTLQG